LDAVAGGERAILRPEHFDAPETPRLVLGERAARGSDAEPVAPYLRRLDRGVAARRDAEFGAAAPEANHVADRVMSRVRPLRARQVQIRKRGQFNAFARDLAALDQQRPDDPVERGALLDGGAHDQRGLTGLMRAQMACSPMPISS